MVLLAGAGVSVSEYRAMSPALADALAERVATSHLERAESNAETLNVILTALFKRLVAIERAILNRPTL